MAYAVLLAGLPGTGKSYIGKPLARQLDAHFLDSDIVRNELQLQGEYDQESKHRVYEALRDKMTEKLNTGTPVVIEATFMRKEIRDTFIFDIESTEKPYYIILLTASDDTIKERLQQERSNSEADFEVYQQLKPRFETIHRSHFQLATDQLSPDEVLTKIQNYIESSYGASGD